MTVFIHESAVIDQPCQIGEGTAVWHFCHVMSGCQIGTGCSLGQNVFVATGAVIKNRVKIQNNVSVYAGLVVEDDVFIGPSVVFTNVKRPRAFIDQKQGFGQTILGSGCSIGANATIMCDVTIGAYAMVAAGSVVTASVPAHALVRGNPARFIGWVCTCGASLNDALRCLSCGREHVTVHGSDAQGIGVKSLD